MTTHRGLYPTDAGMHCLWDSQGFSNITDYESWERELLNDSDIVRHIRDGRFVPLNIQSDGAVEVEARIGSVNAPAVLSERESNYVIVRSQPYRLVSTGQIRVGGIEYVHAVPEQSVGEFLLPAGMYAVVVHLIAWDEEPGMALEGGGPAPGALPDYVVLVNPASENGEFRSELETFDRA